MAAGIEAGEKWAGVPVLKESWLAGLLSGEDARSSGKMGFRNSE